MEAHRKQHGRKIALQAALNACIAEYNKLIKVKKFRVDTLKRKLIGNLMKLPKDSIDILSGHYDLHKHTSSGATSPPRTAECKHFAYFDILIGNMFFTFL